MKTLLFKLTYDENIEDPIPEFRAILNDDESLTEIHLPTAEEIDDETDLTEYIEVYNYD